MKYPFGQFISEAVAINNHLNLFLILAVFSALNLASCKLNREEKPVIPPETSPLSRTYIGFGVITTSFTHINEDPIDESRSLGYLRRGSLVRIVRRQVVKTQDTYVSWVLTDGRQETMESYTSETETNSVSGWLREDVMEIYDNESQARTASEAMAK